MISKAKLKEDEVYMDLMRNELTVLEKTDHPHITRVFELLEDNRNFYVVMEFLTGGDLMGRVEKIKKFSESHVASIIHQVMLALCYMHGKDVTHRDLKPENLMIMDRESEDDIFIKLTDFGFACFFDPSRKMDVILGTPVYMAPELARGEEYDCRVDVWSLGVITHLLLCGELPFNGDSNAEIRDAILKKDLQMYGTKWCKVSKEATDFVRKCLNRTVRDRPFVDALFEHPFIKKWVDNPVISEGTGLQISDNIATFKQTSIL